MKTSRKVKAPQTVLHIKAQKFNGAIISLKMAIDLAETEKLFFRL